MSAELDVTPAGEAHVASDDGTTLAGAPASAVRVSDRLGSIPRRVSFDDGSVFETDDNDGIDRLVGPRRGRVARMIDRLEKFRPRLVLFVAVVAALAYGLYRFAVPLLVEVAILVTPPVVPEVMSRGALASLDRTLLAETELPRQTRSRLADGFRELAALTPRGAEGYDLHFRKGGPIGPNAFALPDGAVVVTDELVRLASDDDAMVLGVLAHEIGHVAHEHSLRRLYRAAGVAALIMLIGGDIGAGAEDVLVQGSALVTLSFSRGQESEADRYAVELMHRAGHDPEAVARFFEVLQAEMGAGGDTGFLSSHPATAERIAETRRLAEELAER